MAHGVVLFAQNTPHNTITTASKWRLWLQPNAN